MELVLPVLTLEQAKIIHISPNVKSVRMLSFKNSDEICAEIISKFHPRIDSIVLWEDLGPRSMKALLKIQSQFRCLELQAFPGSKVDFNPYIKKLLTKLSPSLESLQLNGMNLTDATLNTYLNSNLKILDLSYNQFQNFSILNRIINHTPSLYMIRMNGNYYSNFCSTGNLDIVNRPLTLYLENNHIPAKLIFDLMDQSISFNYYPVADTYIIHLMFHSGLNLWLNSTIMEFVLELE